MPLIYKVLEVTEPSMYVQNKKKFCSLKFSFNFLFLFVVQKNFLEGLFSGEVLH